MMSSPCKLVVVFDAAPVLDLIRCARVSPAERADQTAGTNWLLQPAQISRCSFMTQGAVHLLVPLCWGTGGSAHV